MRRIVFAMSLLALSPITQAAIEKHTTRDVDANGNTTGFTEIVADDNGNLRMEIYGIDENGERGLLLDFVVYQATERKLLSSDGNRCESMNLEGDELPGGVTRDDITAAQSEAQRMLAEMRETNPDMARMLEQQLANMPGMPGSNPNPVRLVNTGESRRIGDYDTTRFDVENVPGGGDYTVWAADVDDVEGGRTISNATRSMMQAQQQMIENMGMGQIVGNVHGEIIKVMDNFYPIVSGDGDGETHLHSTKGNGSENFYPECN